MTDGLHSRKHIEALHGEVVQDVNENPVLRQLAAFLPIHVDDAHVGRPGPRRHAEVAAGVLYRQIGPTEEAAEMSFRQARNVAIEAVASGQGVAERRAVLLLIPLDRKGSTWGHIAGSFFKAWLNIRPTYGLCFLRFGLNVIIRDGKIAKAYILLDIVDVMRQADLYPFRKMPGSAEQWLAPPACAGVSDRSYDGAVGAKSIAIVREMQQGLRNMDLADLSKAEYSPRWHKSMNWYGPAGIGSTRAKRGFREYHGRLFLQAFPDRKAVLRDHDGPQEGPGHYIRIGDGRFAVTSGWPSIRATHLGGGWLGLGPSGRRVEMRVADWYRLSEDDYLIENWVMIDIPHILYQMGLDILEEMRYFADPTLRRWPDYPGADLRAERVPDGD